MQQVMEMMLLPPVYKGFIALCLCSFSLPSNGIYILKKNLLTLRFTLMHGAILGGALGIALGINPLVLGIAINLLLMVIIRSVSGADSEQAKHIGVVLMVITIGLAFLVLHKFRVASKDAFSLLWGSLYSLSSLDMIICLVLAVVLIVFNTVFHRNAKLYLFSGIFQRNRDGKQTIFEYILLLLISLSVVTAMMLIGALLLDALILLPVLAAVKFSHSVKQTYIYSGLIGGVAGITGFFLALILDIPTSSAIALTAGGIFLAASLYHRFGKP